MKSATIFGKSSETSLTSIAPSAERIYPLPVRCEIRRWRTRWRACRSSCAGVFSATHLTVGRVTALGKRLRVVEVIFLLAAERPHIFGRHQTDVVTKGLNAATQVMRPDAGLHADQAGGHVGQADFDLGP